MSKRHVPIRPAPPHEPRLSSESTSGELETKRRRVVVSVACDACRRKKIRVRRLTVAQTLPALSIFHAQFLYSIMFYPSFLRPPDTLFTQRMPN